MKKLILSVVFALALLTTPLFGNDFYGEESYQVPLGVSVGLTGNFGGCTGDCGEMYNPGGGIGLSIGYRPSLSFGVYAEVMKNFVHFAEGDYEDFNVSFIQGNIGINFYLFPDQKFQPLLTAGFGNIHMSAEDDDGNEIGRTDEQQTVFFGFGGEYIISDNMTIPFKLQYAKVVINEDDLEKDSVWNILVGFNYYF